MTCAAQAIQQLFAHTVSIQRMPHPEEQKQAFKRENAFSWSAF